MPDKQDIAKTLKTQREKLDISIEEIFECTRINPEFLTALEIGDFDLLPAAYVRLFLKTYAREVRLDPDEILAQYEEIYGPAEPEPEPELPEHRQTSMTPVLLLAGAFVLILIIALNLREQTDLSAPLDTSAKTQTAPVQKPQPKQDAAPNLPASSETQVTTRDSAQSSPSTVIPAQEDTAQTVQSPVTQQPVPEAPQAENPPVYEQPPEPSPTLPEPSQGESSAVPSPPPQTTPDSSPPATLAPPVPPEPEVTSQPPVQEPEVLTTYALPMPVLLSDEEMMTLSGFVRETTQLAVSADGRELFSGVLQAGTQQRWQAQDRFQVQVQRAGAIALSLQDQPLESASPPDRSLRLMVSRTLIRVEELGNTPTDR